MIPTCSDLENGVFWVNGKELTQKRIGSGVIKLRADIENQVELIRETVPSSRSYIIAEAGYMMDWANLAEITVPERMIYVAGDNRDNALDSRDGLGFVPLGNIIGRGWFIVWHDKNSWTYRNAQIEASIER